MKLFFELTNFSFGFKQDGPLFFNNISVRISEPGLICIVGKNGVGKSTLFRILQGIIFPGEVISGTLQINEHFFDLAVQQDRDRLYRRSMILHQNVDRMLVSNFTGVQNLCFAQFPKYPGFHLVNSVKKKYTDG